MFLMIKEKILIQILKMMDEQIKDIKLAIESAKESRDNETKCTSGDKYETGRAMMQLELEKNRVLLNKTLKLVNKLSQINLKKGYSKVEFGSLVYTNLGNYFISIGIGKIEIDNKTYYSISLASPIGEKLKNKKTGDSFEFQKKTVSVMQII